jgi:DNA repair protein SbcD/Mre11
MKIIHTSDWHLGKTLYGRRRYDEFSAFFQWLLDLAERENAEALLASGDIFDSPVPGSRAQELYYRFLARLTGTCCRTVIITAGNHDSPSFLEAPRQLLGALNIHVIGQAAEDPADELVLLRSREGEPEAIICAVPYLRDRDVRRLEAGESREERDRKLSAGIREHYKRVTGAAAELRRKLGKEGQIPIIASGHLFAAGGRTEEGDGVRELYVGTLARIGEETFPPEIDYAALGHLHVPQRVGSSGRIRYSGSPLPMGYGEASQTKEVIIAETAGPRITLRPVPIPRFQELERITGDLDMILRRIEELAEQQSSAWLEIEYTGEQLAADLRERIDEAVSATALEVRRIRNRRVTRQALTGAASSQTLDDLDPYEVFSRCLDAHTVSAEEREELIELYREVVLSLEDAGSPEEKQQ